VRDDRPPWVINPDEQTRARSAAAGHGRTHGARANGEIPLPPLLPRESPMGRGRVPNLSLSDSNVGGRASRRARRKAGPALIERKGNWHVHGRVQAGGQSIRIRRGTGLPAREEFREAADTLRRQWEREAVDELVHGYKPSKKVGLASREYLGLDERGEPRADAPRRGAREVEAVQDVVREFAERLLSDIKPEEWRAFLRKRHKANSVDTRRRYEGALRSFLAWCAAEARGYVREMPRLREESDEPRGKQRVQKHRKRRQVADLRPICSSSCSASRRSISRRSFTSNGRPARACRRCCTVAC